ncbi:MAG: methyltransferase domain-containing protein [Deltaproteobacteria bacterium]|nr:methyltransferase domain-containing protein [Deltaproteobacteria bacterium]
MITIDLNRMGIRPGDRILDMGCGPGRHVCAACAHPDVIVVGADVSVGDLYEAKEKIDAHAAFGGPMNGEWDLAGADITALPFSDISFDHVICSEVMEHIVDEKKAASELIRILKPGGTLAISVPRYLPERICWALSEKYHDTAGGHVRIYKKERIMELFGSMGMTGFSFHYAHGIHSPYWWLKCLVGPENETSRCTSLYHRFLVWDIMKKPMLTRALDRLLTPAIGKSMVFYFKKTN